jgi:hypothetical protein
MSGQMGKQPRLHVTDVLGAASLRVKKSFYSTLDCDEGPMCILSLFETSRLKSSYWLEGQSLYLKNTRIIAEQKLRSHFSMEDIPGTPIEALMSRENQTKIKTAHSSWFTIYSATMVYATLTIMIFVFTFKFLRSHEVHSEKRKKKRKKKSVPVVSVNELVTHIEAEANRGILSVKNNSNPKTMYECGHSSNISSSSRNPLPCVIPLNKFEYKQHSIRELCRQLDLRVS